MSSLSRASALVRCTALGCRIGYDPLVDSTLTGGGGGAAPQGGSSSGGATPQGGSSGGATPQGGSSGGAGTTTSAGGSSAPAPPPDYCREIPALARAPVIDGVLEPGLSLRDVVPLRWDAMTPLPATDRSAWAVGWRPDGIYIFARVWDASRLPHLPSEPAWCGDEVELFLDSDGQYVTPGDYDDPGTRQFIVVAPADSSNPAAEGVVARQLTVLGPWGSTSFRAYPLPDGYVVEAFIVAADLGVAAWTLGPGSAVGLDFAHTVSPDQTRTANCMRRLGQYFVHVAEPPSGDSTDLPFQSTRAFCAAQLLAP